MRRPLQGQGSGVTCGLRDAWRKVAAYLGVRAISKSSLSSQRFPSSFDHIPEPGLSALPAANLRADFKVSLKRGWGSGVGGGAVSAQEGSTVL